MDTVHIWGFGIGFAGVGLGRIGEVFGGGADSGPSGEDVSGGDNLPVDSVNTLRV